MHKICVLLHCFDSMYARYMSFKRALLGINFMHSDPTASNGENFFIFKANDRGVFGRAPIEDNAENEEIILLWGVQFLAN